MKNYNTDIYEKVLVNDLIFNSNSFLSEDGLMSEYNFIIKNVNTDGKNSNIVKNEMDISLSSLFEYNSSYPMIKKMPNYENILKPKTSIRFGTNQTIDQTNEDIRSNIDNIYSLNRTVSNQMVEGGASLTYGAEFIRTDKSSIDKDIFSFELANVIRFKKNKELAKNSRLGEKNSDIFGRIMFAPDESLKINYDFSLKDNLKNTNYEYLTTAFKVNKFITSFEYLNENNTHSKESYLANRSSYTIDDSNSLIFGTRLNKKTRLTEFYNLIYQYKNDCLSAAIEYKKDYYSDKDLKPEENIFFKLTITPLGGFNTPNLIK
jgi:LPS-assembly protein